MPEDGDHTVDGPSRNSSSARRGFAVGNMTFGVRIGPSRSMMLETSYSPIRNGFTRLPASAE
jgi:hypothetical protein